MENLKIVIGKNKDIANQAKDLLLELGLYVSSEKRHNFYGWVARSDSGDYINDISDFNRDKAKLVTIQELKDMVVLNRNDAEDATHHDTFVTTEKLKCILLGSWWHIFTGGKWQTHCEVGSGRAEYMKLIKEEAMKEYLVKNENTGGYDLFNKHPHHAHKDDIEVPEGAETFNYFDSESNTFFLKGRGGKLLFSNKDNNWDWRGWGDYDLDDVICLWRRNEEPTMQEQLDYANELRAMGESGWSKEKYSHYKKDVSHLNHIDVYRVLELYGVESHAVGHAIKKLLCSGQRGAKDHKQDIQEAIDSLNRELEMVKEDEI